MTQIEKKLRPYAKRNAAVFDKLKQGLEGQHQKSFAKPKGIFRRLKAEEPTDLFAHNPFAHNHWMLALARPLINELGLSGPNFYLKEPVYFLTITARTTIHKMNYANEKKSGAAISPRAMIEMREFYENLIPPGVDFLGMLDIAPYVSSQRFTKCDLALSVHPHLLLWNCTEQEVKAIAKKTGERIRAFIPYGLAVDYKVIKVPDLFQMLWYVTKVVYRQYQLQPRKTGSWKQFDSPIQATTLVRLFRKLGKIRLHELTFAGGRGSRVLAQALRDMHVVASSKRRSTKPS